MLFSNGCTYSTEKKKPGYLARLNVNEWIYSVLHVT